MKPSWRFANYRLCQCGGICDVVQFVVVLLISKIMTSWRVRSLLLLFWHTWGAPSRYSLQFFQHSFSEEGSPTPYDGWQVSAVVNHSAWLYRAAFFLICEPCAKMPGTPKRHWTQAVANNSLEPHKFASLTPSPRSTSCRFAPLLMMSVRTEKFTYASLAQNHHVN